MQLCVFAIGFGGGMLNGATNALAADVSEGERGAKLSLLGVFFGIGALTMPSAIASLSHSFSVEHDRCRDRCAGAFAGRVLPGDHVSATEAAMPSGSHAPESLRLLGDPLLLVACLALAIQSGMEGMSNDWMTRYFKNVTLGGHRGQRTQCADWPGGADRCDGRHAVRYWLDCCKRVSSRTVLLASVAVTRLRRDHVDDGADV